MQGWYPIFSELGVFRHARRVYLHCEIFLLLAGVFTFQLGRLFERGQADLRPFFDFLPWLYLFLIPAVSMRLWAEERRGGTIELSPTLPVSQWGAVLGSSGGVGVYGAGASCSPFPYGSP